MRLYTDCHNCHKQINFFSLAEDRGELFRDKDSVEFNLICKKCNQKSQYHVNKIYAKENKLALVIGLTFFLIGTPITICLLWEYLLKVDPFSISYFLGVIAIPFTIYSLIKKTQHKKVRLFNQYKV